MNLNDLDGKDGQSMNRGLSYRRVTVSVATRWTCHTEMVKYNYYEDIVKIL